LDLWCEHSNVQVKSHDFTRVSAVRGHGQPHIAHIEVHNMPPHSPLSHIQYIISDNLPFVNELQKPVTMLKLVSNHRNLQQEYYSCDSGLKIAYKGSPQLVTYSRGCNISDASFALWKPS
jgi:hypothetical protein